MNSPPSDSDRCEIQPDKTDLPPSSHPALRETRLPRPGVRVEDEEAVARAHAEEEEDCVTGTTDGQPDSRTGHVSHVSVSFSGTSVSGEAPNSMCVLREVCFFLDMSSGAAPAHCGRLPTISSRCLPFPSGRLLLTVAQCLPFPLGAYLCLPFPKMLLLLTLVGAYLFTPFRSYIILYVNGDGVSTVTGWAPPHPAHCTGAPVPNGPFLFPPSGNSLPLQP